MISTEIIVLIITNILAPIITGTVTWMLAKKKYNIEVEGSKIDNLKLIIDTLATLLDSQALRITSLLESLNAYAERNKQLELEVIELRKQVFDLMNAICCDFTCTHRKFDEGKKKKIIKETQTAKDTRYSD